MITPVLGLPPELLVALVGRETEVDELIVLFGPGVASGSPTHDQVRNHAKG